MKIELVPYDKKFLKLSWTWLNEAEVKALSNTPDFTQDDQIKWFSNLKFKSDYLIWGILADNIKIGACGLKNITKEDCEYWGYIGEKSYWGKGIGKKIIELIVIEAKALHLNSMKLAVLENNSRALSLYSNCNFLIENKIEQLIYMCKTL